jgi:transcriptional regulator with XRE-family HTH domain
MKNERKRQGLSMRALAEKAGIRAATICEFENKGSGTLKTFLAIVDGLGLDLEVKKKHKV